jgi:ABC-type transport system involved in multi-copper enzyme maturation permease subunit
MKTASPSPPADPIEALCDFSDRHSPIVVKELRQGLRQPAFVILFLFLQTVLALAVITALFSVSSASLSSRVNMGNVITGFFFGLFGLAIFVIQPLRALGALSSERRDSTIDLLLLTRLDSWRIVFGKWLCLITQSALLLVAMLPYLMMRYFLGGMNIFAELGILAALFLIGAMVCAAGIGMSAVRSVILRVIFAVTGVLAFLISLQWVGIIFAFSGRRSLFGLGSGVMLSTLDWVAYIGGGLLLTAFLTHAFLEFGATRIAPPAENRSTRKRLIALAALLVIPALFTIPTTDGRFPCYLALLFIAPFAMADALSENPRHLGRVKRWSLWMLRPGWPSGAVFCLVMLGLCALWGMYLSSTYTHKHGFDSDDHLAFQHVVFTSLLMVSQPVLFIALFRPQETEPSNLYLTSLLGSLALGLVMLMIGAVVDSHETLCHVLFPLFPVLGFGIVEDPSSGKVTAILVTNVLYLTGAALVGHRLWRPLAVSKPPVPRPPA